MYANDEWMLMTIFDTPAQYDVYSAADIRAWQNTWFDEGNSSFGLVCQASLLAARAICQLLHQNNYRDECAILVCCGTGNNGADGYMTAHYLKQLGRTVAIFAPSLPKSTEARLAKSHADKSEITICHTFDTTYPIYVDALFGIGLNQALNETYQALAHQYNAVRALKIALDVPSGLHPDTGVALPVAFQADYTLSLIALKMGLLTGQGKRYAGKIIDIALIPQHDAIDKLATLSTRPPKGTPRAITAHKGDFGHALIIGGCANMGGAVIIAGECAFASGAGKVSIMCHKSHHSAILARKPSIMVKDMDDVHQDDMARYLAQIDTVAFGMGLGRDDTAKSIYKRLMPLLQTATHLKRIVIDADALFFLAQDDCVLDERFVCTPHSAEAGRLLNQSSEDIESNRLASLLCLQQRYGGHWVLKGAGSLTAQITQPCTKPTIHICAFGNPAMASAGMGDALSGMIAGLGAAHNLSVSECVSMHALAGDNLFQDNRYGISADMMASAIHHQLNKCSQIPL